MVDFGVKLVDVAEDGEDQAEENFDTIESVLADTALSQFHFSTRNLHSLFTKKSKWMNENFTNFKNCFKKFFSENFREELSQINKKEKGIQVNKEDSNIEAIQQIQGEAKLYNKLVSSKQTVDEAISNGKETVIAFASPYEHFIAQSQNGIVLKKFSKKVYSDLSKKCKNPL